MKILHIFYSTDPFEHDGMILQQTASEPGRSLEQLDRLKETYKQHLKAGEIYKLRLLMLEVDLTSGEVGIVSNEEYSAPKKSRVIINEKAKQLQESRAKKKPNLTFDILNTSFPTTGGF